jgi:nicotinate-nucleotide adenylyltransferase
MKIAIFGGSFDPPHYGHATAVSALLNSKIIDQVWILPSNARSDKRNYLSFQDRLLVTTQFFYESFPNNHRVIVSDFEGSFSSNPGSRAILRSLRERYQKLTFYLALGEDLVADLPGWIDGDQLIVEEHFLIISRGGYTLERSLANLSQKYLPVATSLVLSDSLGLSDSPGCSDSLVSSESLGCSEKSIENELMKSYLETDSSTQRILRYTAVTSPFLFTASSSLIKESIKRREEVGGITPNWIVDKYYINQSDV